MQKRETMAVKCCKNRKKISLSVEKEGNDENDTRDDADLDQSNNKYLLQY